MLAEILHSLDLENRTWDLDICISEVTNDDGSIVTPDFIRHSFLDVAKSMAFFRMYLHSSDKLFWMHSSSSKISCKKVYAQFYKNGTCLDWCKRLPYIPLSHSILCWGLLFSILSIDEVYRRHGFSFPSSYPVCKQEEESFFHLFLFCDYVATIWVFLSVHFGRALDVLANCLHMFPWPFLIPWVVKFSICGIPL